MFDTLKSWLPWAGGGVLLVGIIALVVMNPLAAAKLASAVSGFLLDKTRALVRWAWDPERNWWKIGCFSFAGFFAVAAFYAHSQRREAINIATACTVTVEGVQAVVREREADLVKATENFKTCQAALEREVGLPDEVDKLNAEAVAAAQADAAAARRELADFKRRSKNKPADCTAALVEVEKNCGDLSDY